MGDGVALQSDRKHLDVIEPRNSIGFLIRRAQQFHTRYWTDEFRGDLTGPQYAVLAAVARWPGIDQTRAGELASLDKSSGADVINRLAEVGWILRMSGTADRRTRLLRLSAPARSALKDITPRVRRVQRQLLASFTPDDAAAFIRLLAQVAYRPDSSPAVEPDEADAEVIHMSTAPGHLLRRSLQAHTALWVSSVGDEPTSSQYGVLATLILHGEMDQRRLGELTSLDKSVVGDVVARLARKGWVIRERHPVDGRRRSLRISDAGHEEAKLASPGVSHVQDALLAPLAVEDATRLVELLTQVPDPMVNTPLVPQ
ncbi:MarR family winged helix-turn-helix transcriptional regulator [Pseudarthrobacter oxydans]|uniref:MarR family winged helix-turn-helix transcriptional regulator n=1 Tax=Pseudarthrobacter oxydans TaxID=1671 RepID=UPI00382DC21C